MTVKAVIYSYNRHSKGASNLKNEMLKRPNAVNTVKSTGEGVRLNSACSEAVTRDPHVVIVWGNEALFSLNKSNALFLNVGDKGRFTNKKFFFETEFSNTPDYFTSVADAEEFLAAQPNDARYRLVERHSLFGHSGDGIRLVKKDDALSRNCHLWTEYIPKKYEYRVHFFKPTGATFIQQKKRKLDADNADRDAIDPTARFQAYAVRNHAAGWVYCTENVEVPNIVRSVANNFIADPRNTLDYGAIDIIYNERRDAAFILEVNTAPGIEGRTVTWYAEQIKQAIRTHDFNANTTSYHPLPNGVQNAL